MLKITIKQTEAWDEAANQFINVKETVLSLEHSLVSISKWESKWCKPFLSKENKTQEELVDYIKCMTLTQNVDPNVYMCLSADNYKDINDYINADMTATTFRNTSAKVNNEIVTSELIYYWMIAFNIPFECQKWHLNRLLTLVRVCNIKNQPPKKMSKSDIMARNAELNAKRRAAMRSKG